MDALHGEADFVLDVTPPATHEAVAMETFASGLHLIGEKPMSDDFDAARRMVAAGTQAGKHHMITQNYRFGAQPRTTRRLIAEGLLGPVGQVDVVYMPWADRAGSHYVTEPYMFTKDMGIHHFDMLRYVLGQDPISVRCVSWNPSWGWHQGDGSHLAIFRFADGAYAVHRGSGSAVGTKTTWNGDWRIEGPRGTITWQNDEMYYTWLHRTDRRRHEQLFADPPATPAGQDPLLSEFVAALREGREPECNAADNLHSLAMVEGCVRSAQAGGREILLEELLAGSASS
jgi:predicted dehydrogenase